MYNKHRCRTPGCRNDVVRNDYCRPCRSATPVPKGMQKCPRCLAVVDDDDFLADSLTFLVCGVCRLKASTPAPWKKCPVAVNDEMSIPHALPVQLPPPPIRDGATVENFYGCLHYACSQTYAACLRRQGREPVRRNGKVTRRAIDEFCEEKCIQGQQIYARFGELPVRDYVEPKKKKRRSY